MSSFFFFNDTATTEIYTLSLHDALPICPGRFPHHTTLLSLDDEEFSLRREVRRSERRSRHPPGSRPWRAQVSLRLSRSEEHTSELQSRQYLVCRLLLEKKKTISYITPHN